MAGKRLITRKRRRRAARRAYFHERCEKHPLKGMLPRSIKHGALPPNQDHHKYPDEVYGDMEIPFRQP